MHNRYLQIWSKGTGRGSLRLKSYGPDLCEWVGSGSLSWKASAMTWKREAWYIFCLDGSRLIYD